jgi:hypothetical protein
MKRTELVDKLIKEGMSEKTLVRFTERQLKSLAERLMGEAVTTTADALSKSVALQNLSKKQDIKLVGEEDKEVCETCEKTKSECSCKKKDWKTGKKETIETKKWVNKLAEEKFHSFTSKNEIMELIKSKITESEVMEPQHGSKVKKGHNGVPEFMSYDVISGDGDTKTAPAKPTTKPGTKPGTTPSKPKTPYQPGPGPKHKPKAFAEEKK